MSVQAERIGRFARDALVKEAYLTPKPGLVDAENNGAHFDMDLPLLLKSAGVLGPFFSEFSSLGTQDAQMQPDGRLSTIRAAGVEAERAMLAATNGVNTHKGALFLIGVLCYSAGHCAGNEIPLLPETVCSVAARVCSGVTGELGETAGRAYARYGASGARGEAESGYPNALAALASFHAAVARGADGEDGWRIVLMALIARLEDANVLARCGGQKAQELRARAEQIAARYNTGGNALHTAMRKLDRQCRAWRASPGGSADLLACAIFLDSLKRIKT